MSLPLLAVLEPGGDLATALYIVSFSAFIFGVRRGTHPTTAKQGNLIAAAGMAVAVTTTLLLDGIGNWGLLVAGIVIGTAVGVVASADGRALQRGWRRRRGPDRVVGAAPRDLARR
jgi:peptidoglycan/LPS O-acetylase OafA/YrhL